MIGAVVLEFIHKYAFVLKDVAAVLTGLVGLWGILKLPALFSKIKNPVSHFFRSVNSIPDLIDFKQQMDNITIDVQAIKHQVYPNGGGSLNDKITQGFALLLARVRAGWDSNLEYAMFEADSIMNIHHVNTAYMQWTGRSASELLNKGWVKTVHPDDIQMLRMEWQSCINDDRSLDVTYRLMHKDGNYRLVSVNAKRLEGEQLWVGIITRLPDRRITPNETL